MSPELIAVLLLILAAEFVNGWTDAPNAIATVVGTRSLSPRVALAVASVFNLIGVLSGTAVATTIGKGIIDPQAVNLTTVGGAMVGIIVWSSIAARWGIPTSETHALVAGLAGAGLASAGPSVLVWAGWQKVFVGLLFSSVFGFAGGFCVMLAIYWLFRKAVPGKVQGMFRWLQISSSAFMAFSHGSNDGQKFMGTFTLALVLADVLPTFAIPLWVVVLCAIVMAAGTSIGGWRIHANTRDAADEPETAPGICRRNGRGGHHYPGFCFRDPTQHDAHDFDVHCWSWCRSRRACRPLGHHQGARHGLAADLSDLRGHQLEYGQADPADSLSHLGFPQERNNKQRSFGSLWIY
jgi:Phosphate transporter family